MNQHSKKNRTNREEIELNNFTSKQLLRFLLKVNNKFDISTKNYEVFNIVSENGDSIYAPTSEELAKSEGGQAFISTNAIEKLVSLIIDQQQQRVGALLNKNIEDD